MNHSLHDFFAALDALYAQEQSAAIEPFLKRTLAKHRICCGGHDPIFTAALNELGTYYRGVSRYAESAKAFKEAEFQDMQLALSLYESLPEKGIHYANALNLAGTLSRENGHYQKAHDFFMQTAQTIASVFGKNEDYYTACNNAEKASNSVHASLPKETAATVSTDSTHSAGKGLALCRAYYEEVGKPMLYQQFPDVCSRIAAGLVGDGSECLGFDDEISQDHDWGPSFGLWLTNEDYAKFGQALQTAYTQLPQEFHGYTRRTTAGGKGRVGVFRISDF